MPGPAAPPLIVGNWKMHGRARDLAEVRRLDRALRAEPAAGPVVICPPATLIAAMAGALMDGPVAVGGQTCHAEDAGAFTGEVSATMLADAGASFVILGHSERRRLFGERDAEVAAKARAAIGAGLTPIICLGETATARAARRTIPVLRRQLVGSAPMEAATAPFAIAYEPVWAIGGEVTPSPDEISAAHGAIRAELIARLGGPGEGAPILYGGAVTGANAGEILGLPEVGGLLVGRASLTCEAFLPVIRASGDHFCPGSMKAPRRS